MIFKPLIDDRVNADKINDGNGNEIHAINITSIDDIKDYECDTYFIDEFQFLDGNINTIHELVEKGKKFYIAGLNLTAEKNHLVKLEK